MVESKTYYDGPTLEICYQYNYEYTQEQVEKIFGLVDEEITIMKDKFIRLKS